MLTLPQILQMGGLALQFHQCAPVGDPAHFQPPEAIYSFSLAVVNLLKVVAILLPPEYYTLPTGFIMPCEIASAGH